MNGNEAIRDLAGALVACVAIIAFFTDFFDNIGRRK